MMRHLGSEEVNLELGRAAATTGEGGTPFYRGEGAGRWPIRWQLGRRLLMAPGVES
jgi:hypothetical protein